MTNVIIPTLAIFYEFYIFRSMAKCLSPSLLEPNGYENWPPCNVINKNSKSIFHGSVSKTVSNITNKYARLSQSSSALCNSPVKEKSKLWTKIKARRTLHNILIILSFSVCSPRPFFYLLNHTYLFVLFMFPSFPLPFFFFL